MGTVVSLVFSVTGVVAAFSAIALWLAARPHSRAARRGVAAVAIFYLLASTYVVPQAASRALVSGYRPFEPGDVPSGRTVVVVLGAGVETVFGLENHVDLPTSVAAERVLEADRVYRLIHPEWLITSGGNASFEDASEPSSMNMKRLLIRLGVAGDRILMQSKSRDTHEEAQLLADMIRALPAERIVLVTSAIHMRRALGTFRAIGLTAVPAIAHDTAYFEPWEYAIVPNGHGLSFSGEVAHEFAGLTYYYARGWWRR